MAAAISAGLIYALIVFLIGFIFGINRTSKPPLANARLYGDTA